MAADEALPTKQRHTAHRIWQRLVAEHSARVGESTVRKYVARLRRELGGGVGQVAVPQVHQPGEEAEVDFAELWVWLEGALTKLWLFTMRLSCSGRAVHRAFATQAQEAFCGVEGEGGRFRRRHLVPSRAATAAPALTHAGGPVMFAAATDRSFLSARLHPAR